ncbi:MAG: bifunctional adenosylcobinamide kinase/adenosylcobinamide-phosphate guanylyltransferase [Acidimicrobiales bacterium]
MITLVLGGARSGKSALAESLIPAHAAATYVATLHVGDDADLAARVATHRARRPTAWRTLESGPDLPAQLRALAGPVLVDSLGPWVATVGAGRASALVDALIARAGDTVVVSEEVGLGVHPASVAGRAFRDALGTLNQAVAAAADTVVLVVAGCALTLKGA